MMAKELGWFKFSPLKWMTGRIRRESIKTQNAFLELCCQYWKNGCLMSIPQAELEIGDHLESLVKNKIIKIDGDNIKINFLDEQIVSIADTSQQRREAAQERWKKAQNNADAMHMHTSAMQSDADREDKIDKTREDKNRKKEKIEVPFLGDVLNSWNEWIEYRNERKLPNTTASIRKQIKFLGGRGDPEIIAIIDQAIRNNWNGLFEIKNNTHATRNTNQTAPQPTVAIIQPGKSFGLEKGFSRSGSNGGGN